MSEYRESAATGGREVYPPVPKAEPPKPWDWDGLFLAVGPVAVFAWLAGITGACQAGEQPYVGMGAVALFWPFALAALAVPWAIWRKWIPIARRVWRHRGRRP